MLGEWSLTIASIVPSTTPSHSRSRLEASRIGGQHLNSLAPSGISSADDRQVVRARLDGQRHALGLGRADRRQRVRVAQVQDVGACAGAARGVDHGVDGGCLARGRSRREERVVPTAERAVVGEQRRVLGVHDQPRPERGDLLHRGGSCARSRCGNSSTPGRREEALEAEDARPRAAERARRGSRAPRRPRSRRRRTPTVRPRPA